MMQQLAHLVGKNLSMGIDAETASVSELTPQQLVLAATSALNRGIEVRCALPLLLTEGVSAPEPERSVLYCSLGSVCMIYCCSE